MFTKILKYLGIIKTPELSSVMASFSRVTDQLSVIVETNNIQIASNMETIASLRDANDVLVADARKAAEVSDNIKKLIGA